MKLKELKCGVTAPPTDQSDIEEFTLKVDKWDHEEGFRVPPISITEDKRVISGFESVAGLKQLGQNWIHDDDVQTLAQFSNIVPELQSLAKPIAGFVPDPRNVRLHGERNMESIRNSLRSLGQHQAIVVQKQGMIVRVGNARLKAAMDLGWTEIAVIIVDEDDVQATARAIADNKTAELATWDFQGLSEVLDELQNANFDIELIGFPTFEMDALFNEHPANTVDPDATESAASELSPNLEHRVIIHCEGEQQQADLFERLKGEGLKVSMLLS